MQFMASTLGTLSDIDWGNPWRRCRRGDRRLPAAASALGGGHPAGSGPRRPGQSGYCHAPQEEDTCTILSGFSRAHAGDSDSRSWCGTARRPGGLQRDGDALPSLACGFHYQAKYGVRNWEGGGRSRRARRSGASRLLPSPKRFSNLCVGSRNPGVGIRDPHIEADVDPNRFAPRRGIDRGPLPGCRRAGG